MKKLLLTSLKKALDTLEKSLNITNSSERMKEMDEDLAETVRAGVVQKFEVAYELCWKFMKRWLEENIGKTYVEGVPRYELFRLAAENKLIDNVEDWMQFHKLRNETSHTYNVATAETVFNESAHFCLIAKDFFANLESKNG
ncbi:MAG TPA: HI0074 family nucleotidyltransferase substrate-binding subunit [bacterium]|nr:HI0074 family nucleotidyltransferase substrate-binding subunit [bacterium]